MNAPDPRVHRPRDTRLPDFANPPLIEVLLGVQFDPLPRLGAPELGLLWARVRGRFSEVQEAPALPPAVEQFGTPGMQPGLQIELVNTPPPTRLLFVDEVKGRLVQVQRDRLIHNWRKAGQGEAYPRYEGIRETFDRELQDFQAFLAEEQLGELVPTQCEVSYIDEIVAGQGWQRHGQIGEVLTVWSARYSDDFLGEPEAVKLDARYLITDSGGEGTEPLGRLYVDVSPVTRASDGAPVYLVTMTARGAPMGDGVEGVRRFLDLGREWVVRGFASATTQRMHGSWGRRDS